jgi:hypothetical protein
MPPMSEARTLDMLVVVSPRFARSVSLVRDAYRSDGIEGYLLTPTGREVLRRLADALRGETSTQAWSLTGPYGSGKSGFALLAAQLLGGEDLVRQRARTFLASCDAGLAERFFGPGGVLPKKAGRLCTVLVSGTRQPLEKALAARLAFSLRTFATRGRPLQLIERLDRMAREPETSGTAIVGLFEEANEYLERFDSEAAGILLIIDELGRFLEYGASIPEHGDVFVLQELAEAATRSMRPFLFLTILHQAIDRYAEHMGPGRRAEWAKVQGRFEDVAFEERSEQLLRLLANAIRHEGSDTDPSSNPHSKERPRWHSLHVARYTIPEPMGGDVHVARSQRTCGDQHQTARSFRRAVRPGIWIGKGPTPGPGIPCPRHRGWESLCRFRLAHAGCTDRV